MKINNILILLIIFYLITPVSYSGWFSSETICDVSGKSQNRNGILFLPNKSEGSYKNGRKNGD
jgi:hypothetical protein